MDGESSLMRGTAFSGAGFDMGDGFGVGCEPAGFVVALNFAVIE